MTTQHELTERDREIGRLEDEIIAAWVKGDTRLPLGAFEALMSSAKIACEQDRPSDARAAAERALDRLRRAAEAVQS